MHLGMVECLVSFTGHCDLDLWPSFLEKSCPEHISYIIKGRKVDAALDGGVSHTIFGSLLP